MKFSLGRLERSFEIFSDDKTTAFSFSSDRVSNIVYQMYPSRAIFVANDCAAITVHWPPKVS